MAPGPGSFINPHRSHAGSLRAAEVLWWVAAPVPAEAVGRRVIPLSELERRKNKYGIMNEGDRGEDITRKESQQLGF